MKRPRKTKFNQEPIKWDPEWVCPHCPIGPIGYM